MALGTSLCGDCRASNRRERVGLIVAINSSTHHIFCICVKYRAEYTYALGGICPTIGEIGCDFIIISEKYTIVGFYNVPLGNVVGTLGF
jgi:hypothetical protein